MAVLYSLVSETTTVLSVLCTVGMMYCASAVILANLSSTTTHYLKKALKETGKTTAWFIMPIFTYVD